MIWLRPCLGLLPKEQACISLRQSDLAASISRTLPSLSISPLPTMHFSHQSLKCYKLLFNISLAEHLAGTNGHKKLLLQTKLQAGVWNSGNVKSGCIDGEGIKAQEFLCLGSPCPPSLKCYYATATQLNYLKKPDVWDFCYGILRIEGIRETCLYEHGVWMESNGGSIGSVELSPAKGLHSQQFKSWAVGLWLSEWHLSDQVGKFH